MKRQDQAIFKRSGQRAKLFCGILAMLFVAAGFTPKVYAAGFWGENPVITKTAFVVKGTVSNEAGQPIEGASVVEKGTNNGTQTDASGRFTLTVAAADAVLSVTNVGYVPNDFAVGGRATLYITLEPLVSEISSVVVVGYGTQKRRDVLGAISTVRPDKIGGLNAAPTFDAALQGQIPGVSVQSATGVPGAPTKIMIRGANSINSSTNPLWIIDGMAINNSNLGYNDYSVGQNPLSLINSNDIENIQVLKDAASTAIYGSRGSNGVIIVTTKSARGKMPQNSIAVTTGVSNMMRDYSDMGFADTKTWFAIMDATYNNSGRGNFPVDDYFRTVPMAKSKITRDQASQINTNWFNELFRQGSFIEANASSAKAFDGGNYFFSANYRDDKGVMVNNSMKRYSLRSNVEFNPIRNLIFGTRLNFSGSMNKRGSNANVGSDNGNLNGGAGGINSLTKLSLPWLPVYDPNNPDAYYNPYAGFNLRAYSDMAKAKNDLENLRLLGGLYADYNIAAIRGLSLRGEFSFDLRQAATTVWVDRSIRLDGSGNPSTMGIEQSANTYNYTYTGYATYNRTFKDVHNLNVVAGAEANKNHGYIREAQGQGLTGVYQQLGRPTVLMAMRGGYAGEEYLMGVFARANYSFKEKYLIGASFRRDGSSNFTPQNRWGNFSSLALGWVISDEEFMSFLGNNTFLKLRASYGQTGNKDVESGLNLINYNSTNNYGAPSLLGVNGTLPRNIPSLDITWETTNTSDVGLDYTLAKGRVSGTVDYYHRLVRNMLLQGPVPSSAGVDNGPYDNYASKIWGNVGDMLNSGYEFQLRTINLQKGDFRWITDINFSANKNTIKRLTPEADATGKGMVNGRFISKTGHMRNEWYIADFAHVDPQTGIEMIYVVDRNIYETTGETVRAKNRAGQDSVAVASNANITTNFFRLNNKSTDPRYYGGVTNTFEYKGFDLSFLFTFSGGNYIYDFNEQVSSYPHAKFNLRAAILDESWKQPGDVAKYQKLTYQNAQMVNGVLVNDFSREFETTLFDKYMYKGDFIRFKNLQLGYNFRPNTLRKLNLQGVRLFVAGTNLWTKTEFPGWDPEGAVYTNIDQIPQLKTWTAGLNVRF